LAWQHYCALAPDIQTLVVLRFIQGLGASAGMVIGSTRGGADLHTGHAARLMSLPHAGVQRRRSRRRWQAAR
jgi:MFS family permease